MPGLANGMAPLIGKRVTISGLLSRPAMNGRVGVVDGFNEATGRYNVVVGDETLALKPSAVAEEMVVTGPTFEPRTKVTIRGLNAKPELNGSTGTVLHYDEEKGRYAVQVDVMGEMAARVGQSGNLKSMMLRGVNLEPIRPAGVAAHREKWTPEMHDPEVDDHIRDEFAKYHAAKNAEGPMGGMFGDNSQAQATMDEINKRKYGEEGDEE